MVNFMSENVLVICFGLQVIIPFIWAWNQFATVTILKRSQKAVTRLKTIQDELMRTGKISGRDIDFLKSIHKHLRTSDITNQGWKLPQYVRDFYKVEHSDIKNLRVHTFEYGSYKDQMEYHKPKYHLYFEALEELLCESKDKLNKDMSKVISDFDLENFSVSGGDKLDLISSTINVGWVKTGILVCGYLTFLFNM